MSILIFNRSSSNLFKFKEWLGDAEGKLVMLTQVDRPDLHTYDHAEFIESFDKNGWTEIRAVELHEQFGFKTILLRSEYDIIRAARLREYLDIQGQGVESALAYRDKVLMKRLVREAGVKVADFHPINSPLDLYRFALDHGFPLVVKPVYGGGSRGVTVLSDMSELKAFLTAGLEPGLMVEKFIRGSMYHVDGIARDGRVLFSCVSRYLYGCLAYKSYESVGSIIVDPHGPVAQRLKMTVADIICALPGAHVLAFHAEFFYTEDGDILLCEIASRTGGGRIMETVETAYGISLPKVWVRLQCDLPEPIEPRFQTSAGYLVVPPRAGRLAGLPESTPFPWVIDYNPTARQGQSLNNPISVGDNIATALIKGNTEESVEARLVELNEWFFASVRWD